MQFPKKPEGRFRREPRFNSSTDTVDDFLDFSEPKGKVFLCKISYEALEDAAAYCGDRVEEKALEFFGNFQDAIHFAWDRKLKSGQFQPDGPILVNSLELNDAISTLRSFER